MYSTESGMDMEISPTPSPSLGEIISLKQANADSPILLRFDGSFIVSILIGP